MSMLICYVCGEGTYEWVEPCIGNELSGTRKMKCRVCGAESSLDDFYHHYTGKTLIKEE